MSGCVSTRKYAKTTTPKSHARPTALPAPICFIGRRGRLVEAIVRVYLGSDLTNPSPQQHSKRSPNPNVYLEGKSEYTIRSVAHCVDRARKHGPAGLDTRLAGSSAAVDVGSASA